MNVDPLRQRQAANKARDRQQPESARAVLRACGTRLRDLLSATRQRSLP